MSKNEKSDIKYESFEWTKDFDQTKIPKENLIKFVAKTTLPTVHMEDAKEGLNPIRIFPKMELKEAARSLIGRPIGLNHQQYPIYGAYCIDSQWNEAENQVEGIGYVPNTFISKIASQEIKKCSVEFHWRKEVATPEGTEYRGLWFQRVDLLEGLNPGDKGTMVSLFEAEKQEGSLLGEVKGEPFGPYADWNACIMDQTSKGKDAESAKKICGSMQANLESLPSGSPVIPKPDESLQKIKDLEGAVHTLKESIKTIETNQNSAIESAKKAESQRILKEIKEVLPAPQFVRYFNAGAQRFTEEVKKVVRKEESNNPA